MHPIHPVCGVIFINNYTRELQQYRDRIPEFIAKLHHILQQPQYEDYISWTGDNEVVIKNVRKIQERVLPNFFRHRRFSSFVRQLNMYGFSKVSKLNKDNHNIHFKNDLFQKDNIKLLIKIKRNHKKSSSLLSVTPAFQEPPSSISIDQQLPQRASLTQYKAYVNNIVGEIMKTISSIGNSQPQAGSQLREALCRCNELVEGQEEGSVQSVKSLEESLQNKNLMSMRLVPMETVLFPSQCSFYHIV